MVAQSDLASAVAKLTVRYIQGMDDRCRPATLESKEAANELFEIADRLSYKHARVGIDELIEKWTNHQYRPTLRADLDPEFGILADLYDMIAAARGIDVKAYRG